jgi:hypothetical protein
MSDLELLYLVLAVLYAWECAGWFRHGSMAVVTWLGSRWRPVRPGRFLGNQRGGFILAAPLPPLGSLLSAHCFPLALSPEAVWLGAAVGAEFDGIEPFGGGLFRLEQLQTIAANGRRVLVNGQTVLKSPSPAFAQHLVHALDGLKGAAPAEREKLIRKIFEEQFDTRSIRQRWQMFQTWLRPVRWLTNTLFLYLFALTPVLIGQVGLKRSWPGLLVGLLVLTSTTALLFRRAHKALYPKAGEDRFTHFLTVLLSPATAMRAHDVLSRTLLETYHPLALVQVFCPPAIFRSHAERALLELRFPAARALPVVGPDPEAVRRFSRSALQTVMETFLSQNGFDPEELVKPPVPTDETCRAYCPRCRTQYTRREGTCPDCPGVALVEFPHDSSSAAVKDP